jgi:Homeodomain-like domain
MTKPKPKDQLQKRGRKSDFRPEYILIAKACARFGAIEEEIADELHINHATLDNWKKKYLVWPPARALMRLMSWLDIEQTGVMLLG